MIGEYVELSVGMLLVADKNFPVTKNNPMDSFTGKVKIKKGQVIELRFQYQWNFRTECDTYCNASTETLIKNCSFLGDIHEDVRFGNRTKLSEILKCELYHKAAEYTLTRKPNK